jgi:hypothetical protein
MNLRLQNRMVGANNGAEIYSTRANSPTWFRGLIEEAMAEDTVVAITGCQNMMLQ